MDHISDYPHLLILCLTGCDERILSGHIKLNISKDYLGYNISKFCLSSFGEEDCHLNLNYTYPRNIRVQYLRILMSSFGEEDFRRFTLNSLGSN